MTLVRVKYRDPQGNVLDQTAELLEQDIPDLEQEPKDREIHFQDFLGLFALKISDIKHITPL